MIIIFYRMKLSKIIHNLMYNEFIGKYDPHQVGCNDIYWYLATSLQVMPLSFFLPFCQFQWKGNEKIKLIDTIIIHWLVKKCYKNFPRLFFSLCYYASKKLQGDIPFKNIKKYSLNRFSWYFQVQWKWWGCCQHDKWNMIGDGGRVYTKQCWSIQMV